MEPLWSLIVGIWGIIEGSWGVWKPAPKTNPKSLIVNIETQKGKVLRAKQKSAKTLLGLSVRGLRFTLRL